MAKKLTLTEEQLTGLIQKIVEQELGDDEVLATLDDEDILNGELDDFEKTCNLSYQTLENYYKGFKFSNQSISFFRLKHDVEQAKYLTQSGGFWRFFKSKKCEINGIDKFIQIGDEILKREKDKNTLNANILLNSDEINFFAGSSNCATDAI